MNKDSVNDMENKEDKTMENKETKAEETKGMEKVDEQTSAESTVPAVRGDGDMKVQVVLNFERPIDFIPEEERAVEEYSKYALAREKGFFSPVINMIQLAVVSNDCLYARIVEEDDGKRVFEFCQRYSDGGYSPVMSIKQADVLMAVKYGGRITQEDSMFVVRQKRKVIRVMSGLEDEYMGKSCRGELLPLEEVLKALVAAMPKLTVVRADQGELSREAFYGLVMEKIDEYFSRSIIRDWFEKKSYFALLDEHIEAIAEMAEMTKSALLKKLCKFNLLYIAPSSRGYQTKVRLGKDQVEWAYCVLKLNALADENSPEVKEVDDSDLDI